MQHFLRSLILAVALVGCGFLNAGAASVAGRTFLSTGVTVAGAPRSLETGTRIRLVFGANGDFGAQAGCNTMGGTYRIDGATLRIENAGITEMGCDAKLMAQDDWLFELLGSGLTATLSGNDLTLQAGDSILRFLDREIAEPDLPLVGPTWTVTTDRKSVV